MNKANDIVTLAYEDKLVQDLRLIIEQGRRQAADIVSEILSTIVNSICASVILKLRTRVFTISHGHI